MDLNPATEEVRRAEIETNLPMVLGPRSAPAQARILYFALVAAS